MIKLKPGVSPSGIQPVVNLIIQVVSAVYQDMGMHCTVTSLTEGVHKEGSKHYSGEAVDFRTRHMSSVEKKEVLQLVQEALGNDFDCILESTHLHVEYDPL